MAERVAASLFSALADLTKWLEELAAPSMVIGGVAVSCLGQPRLTQDIDALLILPEAHWTDALASAQAAGFKPRIDKVLEFAHRSRVLLLRHESSGIDIDVVFGGLQFEHEACSRSALFDIGGIRVRLPRVEDLLIMKAVARRPKDMQDIAALLEVHPEADLQMIRRWVGEFAAAMTMPDMVQELEALLARHVANR